MNVKDFDFYLPEEQIAQDPLENRSDSRLMVLNKKTGEVLQEWEEQGILQKIYDNYYNYYNRNITN